MCANVCFTIWLGNFPKYIFGVLLVLPSFRRILPPFQLVWKEFDLADCKMSVLGENICDEENQETT